MSVFKKGDKVRRINMPFDTRMAIGYEGTVTKVSSKSKWISVDNHTVRGYSTPYMSIYFEHIKTEETQMTTPVLKNMKIRIKDATHSRMVQEALFEMGCEWQGGAKDVRNDQSKYLYVDDSYITQGSRDYVFDEESSAEVELVTTYSFKPVDQEAIRKAAEKEALHQTIIELQKQLNEMKQKLESM